MNRVRRSVHCAGLACFIALTAWSHLAAAQTTISGGNLGNQTWTASGSPYIVKGDATIQSGATLTIEQGVEVRFASTDLLGSGTDPNRPELIIQGTLDVNGTAAQPVVFTSDGSAVAGTWYGIELKAAAASVNIAHAEVAYARTGISTAATGSVTLSHLDIHDNNLEGIRVADGSPTLNSLNVHDNHIGIRFDATGGGSITRARVHHNSSSGIYATCQSGGGNRDRHRLLVGVGQQRQRRLPVLLLDHEPGHPCQEQHRGEQWRLRLPAKLVELREFFDRLFRLVGQLQR